MRAWKGTKAGKERYKCRQGKAHNLTRKGTKAGNKKRYKGREEKVSETGKERDKGRPGKTHREEESK